MINIDKNNLEKRIFIICPVRGITAEEDKFLLGYVSQLKSSGYNVHYPKNDTNQHDSIGLNICSQNKEAIRNADEIHIYYNPTSTGSVFDVGMAFMADKPVIIINQDYFEKNKQDNFTQFLIEYSNKISPCSEFYKKMLKRKEEIKNASVIRYKWEGISKEALFDAGMIFMAEKPLVLINREDVDAQKTPHKSFQNVLLALDEKYK